MGVVEARCARSGREETKEKETQLKSGLTAAILEPPEDRRRGRERGKK